VAEGKERFIDRLGPTLTSGLVVAFLSAASLGAVSIRDLVVTSDLDIAYIKSDIAILKSDLEKFKSPGGRFTSADGARLEVRIEKLEEFQSACIETKSKIDYRLTRIEERQVEVCERIQNCVRDIHKQELHNGTPSPNNSSSNRSRN
jgi:hypothetical protein